MYDELREMILTLSPEAVGVKPAPDQPVWGVVMETGYRRAVATLAVLADGTVSLYFSSGGAITGAGEHEGPRRAAEELLDTAPEFLDQCAPTDRYPLPPEGSARFYLLTVSGVATAEAEETDLALGRHPLSPLFHQAHRVITQLRLIDEEQSP